MRAIAIILICLSMPLAAAASPRSELDMTVRDTTGVQSPRPVTGGVPLPRGAAPEGSRFTLLDADEKPLPIQTSVLARWKDGSARWVLLDFQADPPPHGMTAFKLSWSKDGEAPEPALPVRTRDPKRPCLASGDVVLSRAENALLRISDRLEINLTLTNAEGELCRGIVESAGIETEGNLRSTLALKGAFRDPDGERIFGFQVRASVYSGLSRIFIEPAILIDSERGLIQTIRSLNLEVVPLETSRSASIGGKPGWRGRLPSKVRLLQVDDENYVLQGAEGKGSKAPGWAEIEDGRGTIAIALRDFWQQWPKSIQADPRGLTFGLFPEFEQGSFDHMQPWYKHQYLFEENRYRLRGGQARRWQVWLDLSGDGASLAKSANAPLVPSADPAKALATGVWGQIAPAGSPGMEKYDAWAENLFHQGYCNSIKIQRDYGAMNWGDWWGERGCNWGNHEYDTPKHILVQFARTGDPSYFYVGDTAARHTSEVDVVHFVNADLKRHFEQDLGGNSAYPSRPGMVHQHCVGHVSGFYSVARIRELYVSLGIGKTDRPYLCLDPYNLGHIWTQGMVYDYFLTGDPWMKETVRKIGDNLLKLVEDRKYQFKGHSHCGRVNGWTMLALAGAYELDLSDERYVRAMKRLAEDALSEQDPNCGGWLYKLPWGHCYCETKHVGEAGFIGSVRINGLSRYFELTGDERIPDAVKRGVTHLNNDTWMEKHSDWRYTSCPASTRIGQTGVTMAALVNSVTLTGDPEHLRILRKAWEAKFNRLLVAPTSRPGLGKSYSTSMYGCPEAMNLFVNGFVGENKGRQ